MRAAVGRISPNKLLWLIGFLVALAAPADADVLEIAPDGSVTIYQAPRQIVSEPAKPVALPVDKIPPRLSRELLDLFAKAGQQSRLSPYLIVAVAWIESSFQSSAHSPKGSVGIMQLMPATAAMLGIDPLDATQNIRGGAIYLRAMLQEFGGDLPLALAAYNAGPEAVHRYGGVPPYRETQIYVARVLERLAALTDVAQETSR